MLGNPETSTLTSVSVAEILLMLGDFWVGLH